MFHKCVEAPWTPVIQTVCPTSGSLNQWSGGSIIHQCGNTGDQNVRERNDAVPARICFTAVPNIPFGTMLQKVLFNSDGEHFFRAQVFCDEIRPAGTLLMSLEYDPMGEWNTALSYLESAHEILRKSIPERAWSMRNDDLGVVEYETKTQTFLQDKFATNDPICQHVAMRMWYGYWDIRESNREVFSFYYNRMANLIRPFMRDKRVLEETRVLPDSEIFRWPLSMKDCDERKTLYNIKLNGAGEYILVDDSLIPLKTHYVDSLKTWKRCILQCRVCGRYFVADSMHYELCSASCRAVAREESGKRRASNKTSRHVESLCRNEYQYWYNRLRKARASWTESQLEVLEAAMGRFQTEKVKKRREYKKGEISIEELADWFMKQREIVDEIMNGMANERE